MTLRRLWLIAVLAAGAAQAQTLQQARDQVDARQYGQALPIYEVLLQTQPTSTDLLIEAARVYGFADRHKDAVAAYRRVIELDPGRYQHVAAALAWQTLWSGNAAASLPLFADARGFASEPKAQAELWRGTGEACVETGDNACALHAYQQALALQPGDKDLQRRIALVWLWMDDYAQAEAAWRALLADDPNDRRAQAGLARTINAAGRHNEAVRLYGDLDDGSDPDLRLDHARALRWAGYDAQAYALLTHRTDAYAVWLRDWRLARELKSYVYGTAEYSTDSDQLDIASVVAAAGTLLAPAVVLEGGYRYARLNGLDGTVNGSRFFGTLRAAFGTPGETPMGLLVPSISLGLNDYNGWTPVTGNAALRWQPVDLWRVSADLGREPVETPLAISNRITVDVASLGVEYRLPPRWGAAAALSYLSFSDGNNRARINGRVDYAVHFKPRVVVGVEAAAFEDSLPASFAAVPPPGTTTPKGYWNPKNYAEARVFAGIYSDPQPWEWYGRVALGIARETDGDGVSSSGNPNLLEFGVAHDVGPSLRWRFFAGGSGSSFAVGNGGSGYWRRYVGFNLTAWF